MASRIQGITVEIGGDTTKLQTALKGLNGEIKSTQTALKDVEKLLKMDPGNTELLAQKEKLLAQAVDETKQKLETLKTAAEQANTALANGDISQEQYDALQREIVETEQNLRSLETQANQSATAVQKIAATGESLKTTGDNISNAGKKLLPVTAAVTGLGTASVTTAANFESSMSQVQATMGITKDSMSTLDGQSVNTMDALSNLAKEMGASTAFSATECAEALNYLALAGYSTQEMADTLPTVLNLAAAGGIDLASASDMVTDAMSALGMETAEADTMVDQMAKTASTTNTSVAQLGEGILTIGATAKSIKGGTAELNTALGILANNGIKGAEGGTHLRNIILSLQNPTDQAAAKMEALGVSVYDSEGNMRSMNDILGDLNTSMEGMTSEDKANIISTIFNKTDLSSVNALLANTGSTWDNLQSSIENSAGAAQQMADTQLDNLQGQLTLLKSALEGLAISFGQLLMKYVDLEAVEVAFATMMNRLVYGRNKVLRPFYEALQQSNQTEALLKIHDIQEQLDALVEKKQTIKGLFAKGVIEPAVYTQSLNGVTAEVERLTTEKDALSYIASSEISHIEETRKLLSFADKEEFLDGFDGEIFETYVDRIVVKSQTELEFQMKCGLNLIEKI